ncbi:MAG TPA: 23S rRNA (guanosine(2251)-2'-O)-methyltransferase RlmB [Candidatus Limnocylindrales bacterium]|nr:23S rRNA (guanosine(2251)-2'-O)-methyltransferase RlmB [Candidatus Limnocylindrales bacterium]
MPFDTGDGPRAFDRPRFDRPPRPARPPRAFDGPPRPRPGGPRPPWREGGGDRRPTGPRFRDAAPYNEEPAYRAAAAPPLEEGEELVAGRRPVEEAFAAGRPPKRLLVTPQRRQALERIVLHATTLRIPIVEVEGGSLTSLAGFDGHQGVALVVEARRFASLEDILARAIERSEPPFVLVLDSLEDPQNVGTLLRSAEAAGVHGVLFPTERQAPLSPAAVKASAGATEHLLLAPVDDLPASLTDLHLRGVRIVGSDGEAPLGAREADLRGALALVVGSEGHGLSPAVRRRCDLFVRIPMRGAIGSLNAAVAGSILLFEVLGQRGMAPASEPAAAAMPAKATRNRASKTTTPAQEQQAEPVAPAEAVTPVEAALPSEPAAPDLPADSEASDLLPG